MTGAGYLLGQKDQLGQFNIQPSENQYNTIAAFSHSGQVILSVEGFGPTSNLLISYATAFSSR